MRIRKDFEELIPPLSPEEFEQLEKNILEEGIRDPLVVWDGTLIDGHNRYRIAQKHHLDYETVERDFYNDEEARTWIIENQFGRRNLSKYDRSVLALKLKPVIAEQAKEKQSEAGGAVRQKSDKAAIATGKELAKIAGVSHDTIHKVEKIEAEATPRTKQLLREGKLSINQAYNSVHPKPENPVQKARKEHEKFEELKNEPVIEFRAIQDDEANIKVLALSLKDELSRALNVIEKFQLIYKEDLHMLSKSFRDEDERRMFTKRIENCQNTLTEIKNNIRR